MRRLISPPFAALLRAMPIALSFVGLLPGSAFSQDNEARFYLGVGTTSSEYWTEVISGATQIADSVDGSVEVLTSEFEGQKLLQGFGTVLAPGCEKCALVVDPASNAFTKAIVDRSANAGAFIVTLWNRPESIHPWDTQSDYWIANLAYDGVGQGYANGMELCKKLDGKGNIVALQGVPDNPPAKQILAGLQKALTDCPGMKLLDTQVGNWLQTEGQRITRAWLTRFGTDINGIFSSNDGMAAGAVAALREQGLSKKILVTGGDGSTDALQLIKSGEMLSTSFNDPALLGAVGAALSHAAAAGDINPAELKPEQRDFYLKPAALVTAANVDTYIEVKKQKNRFSYQEMKKDFWAYSAGQIPVGANK